MLILTRRAGEALRIGDDIEVTVMAVNGSQVRIGINAPRNIAVDREEIAERKRPRAGDPQTGTAHGRQARVRLPALNFVESHATAVTLPKIRIESRDSAGRRRNRHQSGLSKSQARRAEVQ